MTKQNIELVKYSRSIIYLLSVIFFFFFSITTLAQDNVAEDTLSAEQNISQEAMEDSQVNLQDLGMKESTVLPDNPLYRIKRLGRGIKEVFAFNAVKKQKVRLENANKELAEAKMLFEKKPDDDKALKAVSKTIVNYENKMDKVKENTQSLQNKKKDSNVTEVFNYILDTQIKHQKILNNIEESLEKKDKQGIISEVISTIQQTKEKTASYVGEVLSAVEDDNTKLADRIDKILVKQEGSDFKEIRNLEIVNRIRQGVKEDRKQAFDFVENKSLERLTIEINNLPKERRIDDFNRYINDVSGDELQHFKMFDQLKQKEDLPDDLKENIDQAKDVIAQRFQKRIERAKQEYNEEFGRQMIQDKFDNFHQGEVDFKQMRVMEDIRHRFNFNDKALQKEMDEEQDRAITNFKEAFPDAEKEVERFKELSKQMADNPDPTTFRLLQELEAKVMADPKKREFIKQMENATKTKFVEKFKEKGDDFFNDMIGTNPEHFMMRGPHLGPDFGPPPFDDNFIPPNFEQIFDRAIEKQTEHFVKSIEGIDDPEQLENFQKRFEDRPDVFEEIKSHQRDFQMRIDDRKGEVCMEQCVFQDCSEGFMTCMNKNRRKCEIECDMFGPDDPFAPGNTKQVGKEEQCIMDCVGPNIFCMPSSLGEINPLCEDCARKCESFYEGPCLSDKQIKDKENNCSYRCEHCYGEPVMGLDPNQNNRGCIVDIECLDAAYEFGDDPGTGPDSWESGHGPGEYEQDIAPFDDDMYGPPSGEDYGPPSGMQGPPPDMMMDDDMYGPPSGEDYGAPTSLLKGVSTLQKILEGLTPIFRIFGVGSVLAN